MGSHKKRRTDDKLATLDGHTFYTHFSLAYAAWPESGWMAHLCFYSPMEFPVRSIKCKWPRTPLRMTGRRKNTARRRKSSFIHIIMHRIDIAVPGGAFAILS